MNTDAAKTSRTRLVRLLIALAVIVAGSLFVSGRVGDIDLDAARSQLRSTGAVGMVLFLAAFALLQPLHVSGHLFSFTAVLVWGQPSGFLLTYLGSCLASVSAFAFARHLAHGYVQEKLPARFRDLDARIERSGFRTVVLLRALLWGTPAVGFALGASRIPGRTHHLASAVGVLPQVLMSTLLASGLAEAIDRGEVHLLDVALGFIALGLVVVVAYLLGRRIRGPRAIEPPR